MTPLPGNSAALARPRDREGLADILERILDKGVVIAGDIAINLLDIELLTIRVRLMIASADRVGSVDSSRRSFVQPCALCSDTQTARTVKPPAIAGAR